SCEPGARRAGLLARRAGDPRLDHAGRIRREFGHRLRRRHRDELRGEATARRWLGSVPADHDHQRRQMKLWHVAIAVVAVACGSRVGLVSIQTPGITATPTGAPSPVTTLTPPPCDDPTAVGPSPDVTFTSTPDQGGRWGNYDRIMAIED